MTNRTLCITEKIHQYMLSVSLRERDVLKRLRQETSKDEWSQMQIAPEQGQFMAFLVKLAGVRKALEIGVYTGYSALSVALALPADGKLIACDVNAEWAKVAKRYWQEAGVSEKIDLRLQPACQTVADLIDAGEEGTFDFAFIDADKVNYLNYYEASLKLLRPGGLLAIDNVLWGGTVADSDDHSEDTDAIRTLNNRIHHDKRVEISLVPIADGLTLAYKIEAT